METFLAHGRPLSVVAFHARPSSVLPGHLLNGPVLAESRATPAPGSWGGRAAAVFFALAALAGGRRRGPRRAAATLVAESEPALPAPPVRVPVVETPSGTVDVMSRLLKDRVLILGGQVDDEMANVLVAQLLYLAKEDEAADISLYINSPGGSVSAGMAIFDAMQYVPCDVSTFCFGMAASMGAFLLAAGTPGKRKCLPNARVMIHQPLGGAGGQAADIEIQAREILFLRENLNVLLSDFTGQPVARIARDCDRDFFMTPEEAKEYGLIDEVAVTKSWPRVRTPARPSI